MKKNKLFKLVLIALLSACCFVAFRFIKLSYPPVLTVHLGNAFCILAALLIDGVSGGICGVIGMGIGDLLDPLYIHAFPKTVLCKMTMAIVTGVCARYAFKNLNEKKRIFLSILCGVTANIIMEFFFGFIYSKFLLHNLDKTLALFIASKAPSVLITSLVSLFAAYFLYFPLYNRLKSKI